MRREGLLNLLVIVVDGYENIALLKLGKLNKQIIF